MESISEALALLLWRHPRCGIECTISVVPHNAIVVIICSLDGTEERTARKYNERTQQYHTKFYKKLHLCDVVYRQDSRIVKWQRKGLWFHREDYENLWQQNSRRLRTSGCGWTLEISGGFGCINTAEKRNAGYWEPAIKRRRVEMHREQMHELEDVLHHVISLHGERKRDDTVQLFECAVKELAWPFPTFLPK